MSNKLDIHKNKKKQLLIKSLIVLIAFVVVFVPSFVMWWRTNQIFIANNGSTILDKVYYKNDLFQYVPQYNNIRYSYKIWTWFAQVNSNWLIFLRVGVIVLLIATTVLGFIFIRNHWMLFFYYIFIISLFFNWIDGVVDGKVVDYIILAPNLKWLSVVLLWPIYLLYLIQGTIADKLTFNIPDVFTSVSISILLVLLVIKLVKYIKKKQISKKIQPKKSIKNLNKA